MEPLEELQVALEQAAAPSEALVAVVALLGVLDWDLELVRDPAPSEALVAAEVAESVAELVAVVE